MRIQRITSKDNKTLKMMRQPEKAGHILIEGPKLIEEALAAEVKIKELAVATSKTESYVELLERCGASGARQIEVPDRIMAGIGDAITGQGIIALARPLVTTLEDLPEANRGHLLVLDAIQDPGNVGAMIRSASAFGISTVIALDGTANPYGPKAIRASAGACFHLPIVLVPVDRFITYSAETALPLAALDGSAETDISEHALSGDYAIIVGNEGAGIQAELLQKCDITLRIPIDEKLESLNAAVAASIALYELARKRAMK